MQYGILLFDDPKPDTSRKIIHVDMDAFYASIEVRDNPTLHKKPVIIAKHPQLTGGRGIVSTCNYEARKYGIHSAMSAAEAYKRCPHGVFIQGRYEHYKHISQQIHGIFRKYTDRVEPVSLDEAYLDVTDNKLNINSGTIIAKMIQREIFHEINLTCSVGISYNKFIAKIASDYNKPFGMTLVEPKDAVEFLKQLPIKDFQGIGEKSLPHFHEMDIYTGADLYEQSLDTLIEHFGKMGYSLYFKVRGIHNSPVLSERQRKSIGKERTFSHFIELDSEVTRVFEQLTKKVVAKLERDQLKAYTLTIKIRYSDFETLSRQMKSDFPLETYEQCIELVRELWNEHGHLNKSIRLLGVSVSNFEDSYYSPIQLKFN